MTPSMIDVAQHFGEVPAGPELAARRIGSADGLTWRDLVAHGLIMLFGSFSGRGRMRMWLLGKSETVRWGLKRNNAGRMPTLLSCR